MKLKFDVKGMTCASCQAHVEKAVKSLDGVTEVNVNLLKNTLQLQMDETVCSVERIKKAVENAGYELLEKSVSPKKNGEGKRLVISFAFLLVLMYFCMGNMMWNFPTVPIFDHHKNPLGHCLIQLVLTVPIIALNFRYFVNGTKLLFRRSPNMDTLVSVGATFSFLYSLACTVLVAFGKTEYHTYLYYEAVGMILCFVSLGKFLENLSKRKTTSALDKLVALTPQKAVVWSNGQEVEVDASAVQVGDLVVLKKGGFIPVDGVVVEGSVSVDQSNLTGESIPVLKGLGEEVCSATVVSSGYAKIRATKVGQDTSIANVIRLVEEASSSKAPISKLADKISGIFVPVILILSVLVFACNFGFILWQRPEYVSNAFATALNFAVTVVVIACPCALGLATPVAIMVGTGKGAENGLLIKNAEILEKAHSIGTVVLDKTGTVTQGKPVVTDFIALEQGLETPVFSLENRSEHPLANAITEYFVGTSLAEVSDYRSIDGEGIFGIIDGKEYSVGNAKTVKEIPEEIGVKASEFSRQGKTPLFVSKNGKVCGLIAVQDQIKPTSKQAVETLKKQGVKVVMLTGDNEKTARAVAEQIGVNEVIAEVRPEDKARVIESLKGKHGLVAMVGDGVNDAVALTSADLGIAIGAGSDVAVDSADIVLVRNDIFDVVNVMNLSKRVLRTIRFGLFWAFFYNLICVVLATGIFYYFSGGTFKMVPTYGSIAMSISSVSVVLNALTVNKFKAVRYEEKIERKENTTMVYKVEGMMCKHCKMHVENAVGSIDGVVSVNADFTTGLVTVETSKEVSTELIKQRKKHRRVLFFFALYTIIL